MLLNFQSAWTNMWNKMMEGVERQNSNKGFEKNEHACSMEGVFVVLYWSACLCLKVVGQTSKHQQARK